jgi:hypothetical protein
MTLFRFALKYHHHLETKLDRFGEILGIMEKTGFGYQMSTWTKPPFTPEKFQDLNVFFYKK